MKPTLIETNHLALVTETLTVTWPAATRSSNIVTIELVMAIYGSISWYKITGQFYLWFSYGLVIGTRGNTLLLRQGKYFSLRGDNLSTRM